MMGAIEGFLYTPRYQNCGSALTHEIPALPDPRGSTDNCHTENGRVNRSHRGVMSLVVLIRFRPEGGGKATKGERQGSAKSPVRRSY